MLVVLSLGTNCPVWFTPLITEQKATDHHSRPQSEACHIGIARGTGQPLSIKLSSESIFVTDASLSLTSLPMVPADCRQWTTTRQTLQSQHILLRV
jgi:hypothetical protein